MISKKEDREVFLVQAARAASIKEIEKNELLLKLKYPSVYSAYLNFMEQLGHDLVITLIPVFLSYKVNMQPRLLMSEVTRSTLHVWHLVSLGENSDMGFACL
jgi:hypothetical protein